MTMRLDKLLSECGVASRKESARAAKAGQITVDGVPVKSADVKVDPQQNAVVFCGRPIQYRKFVYFLLNKPDGYVSATEDGKTLSLPTSFLRNTAKWGFFPAVGWISTPWV